MKSSVPRNMLVHVGHRGDVPGGEGLVEGGRRRRTCLVMPVTEETSQEERSPFEVVGTAEHGWSCRSPRRRPRRRGRRSKSSALVNKDVMSVTEETFQEERSPLKEVGTPKHVRHVSHRRDVPAGEVAVEAEMASEEHGVSCRSLRGDVPGVERSPLKEVAPLNMDGHVGHRGDVPGGEVAGEEGGIAEHVAVMSVTRLRLGTSAAR